MKSIVADIAECNGLKTAVNDHGGVVHLAAASSVDAD